MKHFLWLALLAFQPANGCEMFGDIGKTTPSANTQPVGVMGVGCRFDDKYDVALQWVGEAELYDGAVRDDGFPLLTVARVFKPFDGKFLGSTFELYWGLGFKESDRCAYNGELNCNRRMPLPVNAHFGFGFEWSAMRLKALHDSNNAMDYGPENKNLGITWLTLEYRFK